MMNKLKSGFLAIGLFMAIFFLPADVFGQRERPIVGMSIACSNDRVYTWYSNGTVSVGNSRDLAAYQSPHPYSLPYGRTPDDIIEIGIASNDHVYAWYRDGTVSSGTSTDLDHYREPYRYTLRRITTPIDIVGIDIACSNDRVYAWYFDGDMSTGTSDNLDKYPAPYRTISMAPGHKPSSIVGIGIAKNDHVYAWYLDRTVSSGTSDDLDKYLQPYSYVLGRGSCDLYPRRPEADETERPGFRIISALGSRGQSCNTKAEIAVSLKAFDSDGRATRILTTQRVTGINFEVPIKYPCTGNGTLTILLEVSSEGRMVRSRPTTIANCF